MTYNIISTGSKGNAVVINDTILIDCGVPFKLLEPIKKHLRLVLMTHQHGDHFNRNTVRDLAKERPTLRWGCCQWMAAPLVMAGVDKRRIDIFDPGNRYLFPGNVLVRAEPIPHNVPNCGYHICIDWEMLFYATDTGTLDGVEAKGYDLYLIEANHGRAELEERIRAKQESGKFAYEFQAAANHLSREQAEDWLYQQMGPNSRYQFLHQHKEEEMCRTGS